MTPLVAHDLKRQEMKLSQLMILPAGELHLPESILAYDQSLSIDYGRQDDKIYPAGRGVGKSLKQLFQEKGVPPWLRASWPLLGDEKGVLWVPGICFDQRWQKKEDSVGSWQPFGLSEQPFFVSLQYHLDPS
ncbi:MAG: tRNA lysidine(34) synthetase TilS [Nitrincola sp.]|nr:tRNA lysidine(34) synthetase TilS [Nitrincola sp.]